MKWWKHANCWTHPTIAYNAFNRRPIHLSNWSLNGVVYFFIVCSCVCVRLFIRSYVHSLFTFYFVHCAHLFLLAKYKSSFHYIYFFSSSQYLPLSLFIYIHLYLYVCMSSSIAFAAEFLEWKFEVKLFYLFRKYVWASAENFQQWRGANNNSKRNGVRGGGRSTCECFFESASRVLAAHRSLHVTAWHRLYYIKSKRWIGTKAMENKRDRLMQGPKRISAWIWNQSGKSVECIRANFHR